MKLYSVKYLFRIVAIAAIMLAMAGCSNFDPDGHAETMASSASMSRQLVKTDNFTLTAFSRISRQNQPLNIYIEGDGFAWLSRSDPSRNPTPHQATGLALATADPSANVIYIARPCQFTPLSTDYSCGNYTYWTSKRFAPEVISSVNQAIDHFSAMAPGQKINLVGYSGGAAVAALVAARRTDIATLRTVAGNMDTEAFNSYHSVSAMPDSLNPLSVAPQLANLAQEHFVGDNDEVVPALLSENFIKAMGNNHCAVITHVANATHEENWLEFWRNNVSRLPVCR